MNKNKCITDCFYKNTKIIHPITGLLTQGNTHFCATVPNKKKNKIEEKEEFYGISKCENPTTKKQDNSKIIIPEIFFNINIFLDNYYNIDSYEKGIEWLEENENIKPNFTVNRILACFIGEYCYDLSIIDQKLIKIIINYIKREGIKIIYHELYLYLKLENEKIIFKKDDSQSKNENMEEKKKYIYDNYINKQYLTTFFNYYIEKNTKEWNKINNHLQLFMFELIQYIKNN